MKLEVKGDFSGQVAGHNVVHGDLIHIGALHLHVSGEELARLMERSCCGGSGQKLAERPSSNDLA
ncbi:MAG: hypothetical protein U1E96_08810 [Azonexus sp.]